MSSSDSHDTPDSGSVFSRDAITPRGGFMARPGLKPPPRHAVVVRGGNAPVSEHIPVARSSFPPPPPVSERPPVSLSEKITLRAIPTPKPPSSAAVTPRIASIVFDDPPGPAVAARPCTTMLPPVLESAAPLSDAPTVSNIEVPEASWSRSRRRGSRWTILGAGAAGLILGLASVAVTTRGSHTPATATVAAASLPEPPSAVAPPLRTEATAVPSPSAEPPSTSSSQARPLPSQLRPPAPSVKKSIF